MSIKSIEKFAYRLFFTRDDDLDLLQVIFIAWTTFVGIALYEVGKGQWRWPSAAYALAGSVFATLAIAGTPKWIATLLAQSKAPSDLATALASATVQPDLFKDDERG